jgi:acyl-CoA dehydrogenase
MASTPAWPPRTRGLNFFEEDPRLKAFLRRHAPGLLARRGATLQSLGAFAGGRLDVQAERSDQDFPPALKDVPDSLARPTARVKELRLNAEYEECQQELYRHGVVAAPFDRAQPESHLLPFVTQYLVSKTDIATGCPLAMTHPVAFVLDRIAPQPVRDRFLPEILRTDGRTAICGTWATERHSGSDVGASVTTAQKQADGSHSLTGHNWFTSAFGFKKFLAIKTARPDGAPAGSKGLGLYLVPSHTDAGWSVPNSYEITHLKRKLGTKGLPTVEVTLPGTQAYEIAPAGEGLKTMMTALTCSRVHNAMAAAGVMHRAYMEAMCWAENRETFGKKLRERPMVQKRLLALGTEWAAGCALAFSAARQFDECAAAAKPDPAQETWMRLTTALAKFKTAEQAVWCAQKALELVGGNGYTEDYPAARQFRDAMVLPVWEGPEQIQALELMRMLGAGGGQLFLARLQQTHDALPAERAQERAALAALRGTIGQGLAALAQKPGAAELVADEFLHKMADALAYTLLVEDAAFSLAHERDAAPLLTARHFESLRFGSRLAAPSFEKSALHRHFNAVAAGAKIAPEAAGLRPGPAPGGAPRP